MKLLFEIAFSIIDYIYEEWDISQDNYGFATYNSTIAIRIFVSKSLFVVIRRNVTIDGIVMQVYVVILYWGSFIETPILRFIY